MRFPDDHLLLNLDRLDDDDPARYASEHLLAEHGDSYRSQLMIARCLDTLARECHEALRAARRARSPGSDWTMEAHRWQARLWALNEVRDKVQRGAFMPGGDDFETSFAPSEPDLR